MEEADPGVLRQVGIAGELEQSASLGSVQVSLSHYHGMYEASALDMSNLAGMDSDNVLVVGSR